MQYFVVAVRPLFDETRCTTKTSRLHNLVHVADVRVWIANTDILRDRQGKDRVVLRQEGYGRVEIVFVVQPAVDVVNEDRASGGGVELGEQLDD